MAYRLRQGLFYMILAASVALIYLLVAKSTGHCGFPLDDAWIHQTYARNLAATGNWEYVPGQASAGSTAPLWTWLLSWGYRLHLPYRVWTLAWGIALLGLVGLLSHRLAEKLMPERAWIGWAAGILCVAEWHLVWAAASGMETLLFLALSLAVFIWMAGSSDFLGVERKTPASKIMTRSAIFGILVGLLVLTRPEGVLLLFIASLVGMYYINFRLWLVNRLVWFFVGAVVPILLLLMPYIFLNLEYGGRFLPNTFYAKQAEYAILQQASFLQRFGRVALPPLIGFQILFLPGLYFAGWKTIRLGQALLQSRRDRRALELEKSKHDILFISLLVYVFLYLLLYAWRLPVDYQHGRYLMPLIPPIILVGFGGSLLLVETFRPGVWRRVSSQTWMISLVLLLVLFLYKGAGAFAQDVNIIQKEMVAVAEWISENTDPGEWVAAHDIGAIGFFAERPILDLAGLINPEVVSALGDERMQAEMVLSSRASYLVTAPGWPYTHLTGRQDVVLLYQADCSLTKAMGMNNSEIYALPKH